MERLRGEYVNLVQDQGAAALRREGGPEHITASCFIFSPDLQHTLLCFHRKGRFWVQTGGHVESVDTSVAAAALREAQEEAGIAGISLVPELLDLDRHRLGAGFGPCRAHWDIGFAALAGTEELPRASEESEQVGWFPLDHLPAPLAGSVDIRLHQLRSALSALSAT